MWIISNSIITFTPSLYYIVLPQNRLTLIFATNSQFDIKQGAYNISRDHPQIEFN